MATQTGTAATKEIRDIPQGAKLDHRNQLAAERLNNKISNRAYELYQENGQRDGDDIDHWLRAEMEIFSRFAEVRKSGDTYSVTVPVSGFRQEDISVEVEPTRGIVVAERSSNEGSGSTASERESVYVVATWPEEVDPATATATLQQDSVTISVKRSVPR